MRKKILALLMGSTMILSSLAGCGSTESGNANTSQESSSGENQASSADGSGSENTESGGVEAEDFDPRTAGLSDIFPLEEPITLTYYIRANGAMTATMETYAEVEFFKELEKMTNVHIEWNHNTSDENFALMMTNKQLPDMINWQLGNAAGGVEALVEDGIILNLTEMMPKYAPNYYAWMKANPEEDMAFKLDDGSYYQFVNFNCDWDDMNIVYFKILGPQIRKDWLDKVNMSMPTTTDELYEVLKAFKENDVNGNGDPNDEIPMVIVGGADKNLTETMYSLAGSFGTRRDFHLSNGELVYGPITDNYKEFLIYMNKLYTEGLINSDFAVNGDAFDNVLQEKGGFAFNSMGSGLIATREMLQTKNADSEWTSVPWLIGPDGYQSNTQDSNANPRATAITTACEYPEIAMAWLDFAYSYAGSMMTTYGIEGESYEFVDGKPIVKDEVKQNDNGWSEEQSISRWMLGAINYPNARDKGFYEQMNLNEDYKVEIQTNWNLAKEDITIPPIVMTSEESSTYAGIMSDIETYVSECSLKFIVGDMDIEKEWDSYVSNVTGMNLDGALACKQAAYERYQGRE